MSCNCKCRKSAIQKYNFTTQALTTTPAPLNLGSNAGLPTGPAIVDRGNNIGVARTGLYRLTAQLIADVTTAGTVNVQAYYNGVPIAASLKALPAAIGSVEISLDNLLYLIVPTGCGCESVTLPIDIYAWTTDPGVASVTSITANLLKEA